MADLCIYWEKIREIYVHLLNSKQTIEVFKYKKNPLFGGEATSSSPRNVPKQTK